MQDDKKMQDSGGLLKDHQPVPTNFTYDHSFLEAWPSTTKWDYAYKGLLRHYQFSNEINKHYETLKNRQSLYQVIH